MTSKKLFFHSIDESNHEILSFGDGYALNYKGKGEILFIFKNNEEMVISNVLYLLYLKTNILNLQKLD